MIARSRLPTLACAAAALLACAPRPDRAAPPAELLTRFAPGTFTSSSGVVLPYRLLAPADAADGVPRPLVLHLHGSGAIGDDNRSQLAGYAAPWASDELRRRYDAYVLAPQFPARTAAYAPGADGLPASRALAPLDAALELLDSLRRTRPIDATRIYVVGFSMGGSSVWHALLRRPATFAAAISMAGVPPERTLAPEVPPLPILLLHGTADTDNDPAATRAMAAALRRAGRTEVELREYPGLGHEMPPDVARGNGWRDWLFRHRRPPAIPLGRPARQDGTP